MHKKIPSPSELIAQMNHPTVTVAAVLEAGDMPLRELNIDVQELTFPEVDGPDLIRKPRKADVRDQPALSPSTPRTTRVTVRVPARLLAIYKARAKELGIGYQTLMIRTLLAAQAHL